MKSPSTRGLEPVPPEKSEEPEESEATRDDRPSGTSKTRTRIDGEPGARLPYERDESTGGKSQVHEQMRTAHEDAVSEKVPTDRSEEANAAYEKLRGEVPGSEHDEAV